MKMFKNDFNIEMTRGDTYTIGLLIKNLGQTIDSAYLTVKNNFDDTTPLIQKDLTNGIALDHIDGEDYYYSFRIAPNDTKDLEPKKYYYDLEINVNNDTFTLLKGILDLTFDVTN